MTGPPLADRRLVFVLGKGGVGKSVVAAALGTAWAARGERALVIEVQGQNRVSEILGADTADRRDDVPVEVAPGLFSVSVDIDRATEEYLASQLRVRALVDLLARSRAFHTFTAAAPGLAEMVTLGRIWELAIDVADGAPVWDRLVVDCPATGHGIALLEIAANVGDMAGEGPVHDQAARIHEVITHPAATGVAVVARPEELPVTEAVEAVARLREGGFPVAAAVLNGVHARRFDADDVPALEALAGTEGPTGAACRAALTAARRRAAEDVQHRRLAAETGLDVVEMPLLTAPRLDAAALAVLAEALVAAPPAPVGR